MSAELVRYDTMCRAIAEAHSVDEVLQIHDQARALAAAAKVAKNRDAEARCIEMRLRATRRLDELRRVQKDTVGLNEGGRPPKTGLSNNPVLLKPTLAEQGIGKALAHQARVLGSLSDKEFEADITDARDKVARAARNAVREVEILQERNSSVARTYKGGTVADLETLAASGFRASVIYTDVPSRYTTYSGKGKQRRADRYYDTMAVDEIKAIRGLSNKEVARELGGSCRHGEGSRAQDLPETRC